MERRMDSETVDLDAYLERIQWSGPTQPDLDTLAALQRAHVAAIPFENLDVQLGIPIHLDLTALQDKLVARRRGGYCFEQNSLFAAILQHLGYEVVLREARVRRGSQAITARSHLVLQVALPGGSVLADVGFGADGPLGPIPMDGSVVRWFGEDFRVQPEGVRLVLRSLRDDVWRDLYAVEPGTVAPVDLVVANHYTSTHPDSRFVQTLTAQLSRPYDRWSLRNYELTHRTAQGTEVQTISPEELIPTLDRVFDLAMPGGTVFRFQREQAALTPVSAS